MIEHRVLALLVGAFLTSGVVVFATAAWVLLDARLEWKEDRRRAERSVRAEEFPGTETSTESAWFTRVSPENHRTEVGRA